jgi:F420-dependent oxidoreductase-like protein
VRIDLDIAQHQLTWDEVLARARFAEEAGFTGAWVFDHFKPLYGPPGGPCLEAWSLIAGLAAHTQRIRLGPLVTGVTYRHPSLLAAEVVTADNVSGGRIDLGLGAAWFDTEHQELGFEFPAAGERISRLDEAVDVIRLLMTETGATYDGTYYQLRNATYRPLPVQEPHPPVWIGGDGENRMLPLAARQADVWHGYGNVTDLTRKSQLLTQLATDAGRDPGRVTRSTSLSLSEPWDAVRRKADALRTAGFTVLIASWPAEGRSRLEEFVSLVLPELQEAG